ncbi:MAG: polysaccharide biosynthesis tyrosine autokinase [Chthonomonadales bacterium]|nr:polysaccharide biosynthesis tyrosine autokinase [Chthonomonadales bacterium]
MDLVQPAESHPTVTAGDVLKVLWRRLWVIVLMLAFSLGTAYFVSKSTPKRWRGSAQMILIQRAAVVGSGGQTVSTSPMVETSETQIAMLQSIAMARRTIDWMKNDALSKGKPLDAIPEDVEDLQESISATAPRDTNLLNVSVEAGSRVEAEDLTNAVCQAFVQWKREVAQQNAQDTSSSLETRAARARTQMIEAEALQAEFNRQHRTADVSAQQKALADEYMARDAEVQQLKQVLAAGGARLREAEQRLRGANAAIAGTGGVRDDGALGSLQAKLNDLELQRATLLRQYMPAHPEVRKVDGEIAFVKTQLAQALRTRVQDKRPTLEAQGTLAEEYRQAQLETLFTRAKLDAAARFRDQLRGQISGVPRLNMEYARLVRNAELARNLYTSLQTALNSVRLDKDMASGNVQIAQYAFVPDDPFRPSRSRDLLFGGAIGVFLAIVSVLLLEQSDRRVRSVDDVRRLVNGPVVGVLPRIPRSDIEGLATGDSRVPAVDAYSLARANLSLALRSTGHADPWHQQIILVTSAIPGEGKSVTAAAMARTIARSGKSVILVDTDVRRPSMSRIFGTAETSGLSDVLTGEMPLSEAIVSTDTPNLYLVHAGPMVHNPTELLSLPVLKETLERLRAEADVVVLDAAACTAVADALLLAPHVDCILYVVGAGLVDQGIVRDTVAALSAAAPDTMVFFVNRAPREHAHTYRYYYAYSGAGARRDGRRGNGYHDAGSELWDLSDGTIGPSMPRGHDTSEE